MDTKTKDRSKTVSSSSSTKPKMDTKEESPKSSPSSKDSTKKSLRFSWGRKKHDHEHNNGTTPFAAADFDLDSLKAKEQELIQIYKTVQQDSILLRKAIHDFEPTPRIKELSHKIAKQVVYAEELKSAIFAKSLDNSNNHAHQYHPF